MSLNSATLVCNRLILNGSARCGKYAFCELDAARQHSPLTTWSKPGPRLVQFAPGCIKTGQFLYRNRTTIRSIAVYLDGIQHIKCWHVIERNKSTSTNSNKEL
jgi:hypothetical protein